MRPVWTSREVRHMERVELIAVYKDEWEADQRLIQRLKGQLRESREENRHSREWAAAFLVIIGVLVAAIVLMLAGGV